MPNQYEYPHDEHGVESLANDESYDPYTIWEAQAAAIKSKERKLYLITTLICLAIGGVIAQLVVTQMPTADNPEVIGIAIIALFFITQAMITSKIVSGWVRKVDKAYPGFREFYKRKREQEAVDNSG